MKPFDLKSREDCAYLAGLFDGEGHVELQTYFDNRSSTIHYKCTCGITNTCIELVKCILASFGGHAGMDKSVLSVKTCLRWRISNSRCLPFLRAILPYLRIEEKKDRVLLCLEMAESFERCDGRGLGGIKIESPKNILKIKQFSMEQDLRKGIYDMYKELRERQKTPLYPPPAGEIAVDGVEVTQNSNVEDKKWQ